MGSVDERFARNIGVLTEAEQEKLLCSTIAVVGLGCTGCIITEFLARAGVQNFILVDGDRFDRTNINRQLYARESTLGRFKVEVARESVSDINPEASVVAHAVFLEAGNASELLGPSDLVVSGVDDTLSMVVMFRAAADLGKTSVFVLSGCVPFQGVCAVVPPSVNYEDFMGLGTKAEALEGREPSDVMKLKTARVDEDRKRSAKGRGVMPGTWESEGWKPAFGITSNIVALLAANEVIKVLIGRRSLSPIEAPQLVYFDGATCRMWVRRPELGSVWYQGDF